MHRTARILCAALAAAAFACGGGGGGGGGGSGSTVGTAADALQHCTTYWNEFWDRQGSCASMASALVAANKATSAAKGCAQLSHEVGAGRARFDKSKGSACLTALRALDCAHFAPAANSETFAPCAGVVTGLVANQATCYSGFDCVSGGCDVGPSGCSGSCATFAAEGQDCAPGCAPGFDCRNGVCGKLSGDGGPCPCDEGLRCDTSGTCRPQGTAGAPCQQSAFPSDCAYEFDCASDGTCRRLAGAGESCDPAQDPSAVACADGFHCESGRCAADPVQGEPCVSVSTGAALSCVTGFCDSTGTHLCETLHGDGAPCAQPFECASRICSAGHCAAACTAP